MNKVTVIVIDDHPLFRQGVVDSFSLEPDFIVVGQESDGDNGLELIRKLKPVIAIVDLNLPNMNGLQITHQVVVEKLPTSIVLITAYDDPGQRVHAMQAGAKAFCSKDVQPERLIAYTRLVLQGKQILVDQIMEPQEVQQWLSEQTEAAMKPYMDQGKPYEPLSHREMEVLVYITRGMSNKEIAVLLGISHQTVKNHVTSILRKLSVEDRTQAAVFALKNGWVRLSQEEK